MQSLNVPVSPPESPSLVRRTLGPLFFLLCCPPTVLIFWCTVVHLDGSLLRLFSAEGLATLRRHWPWPSMAAARLILAWVALQFSLMVLLPGREFRGPVTPQGNQPRYKLNGVLAYFLTHLLLYVGSYRLGWFAPSVVYDHLGSLLSTLNVAALLFCGFLYVKGAWFPSSSDSGRSGNAIFDYYWGVELHPHLFGVNLKQLINCRVAMMGWSVMILSYAARQAADPAGLSSSMVVAVALQVIYIIKFFVWEDGYFTSLDIMHDRFGFYICWGVLCWLPCVYTLSTMYLVKHPYQLSLPVAGLIFVFGVLAIWANYSADEQRLRVRKTGGETLIWGRPPQLIHATYTTGDGQVRQNLLLASGYWGVARHFHYVAELTLALMWTLPVGTHHALPYFYFFFLTLLLFDRAGRDDRRCQQKYGEHWAAYCARVPYKIIPGIY